MTDEVKSEFAQQVVEPPQKSEFELVQERITNYTIPVTPNNAQTISSILELGLAKGNFKLSELDSLVSIREEVNKGLIEYQTQVQVAQRRLQELQEEETARIVKEREDAQNELFNKMTEERQNRKKAEEELRLVKAQLDALSNVQGNVTSAPITSGGNAPSVTGEKPEPNLQPEPKVPGKTSPAFAVARALNPVKEEESISEDKELVEKVEETKKSFKEWEESKEEIVLDVPEDAKGTEDFFKEVAKVEEETEELIPEEDFDEEEQNFLDEELEDIGEDLSVDELDSFEEELKVAEEDTTTQPTFPITGGNAPNLKGQVSAPQKVSAVYDSEEELLKAVQDKIDAKKQEEVEEYDEIVIPSSDELENMTKKQIQSAGKELGFKLSTTDTKDVMIQSFLEQTQELIQDLQDSGEFVSASDEGDNDKNEDVRDGGYF